MHSRRAVRLLFISRTWVVDLSRVSLAEGTQFVGGLCVIVAVLAIVHVDAG